jgi:uncharacterized protein involved in exopolysaccharide biosynthesis
MPKTDPSDNTVRFVDTFEVRWVGRTMRRHGWVILIAVVIGALAGAGLRWLSPPVYRAEAVLLVNIQSVKIGADAIPMDVELIPPARRTVGTICQSDAVMTILNARLGGGSDPVWPTTEELAEMVSGKGHKSARTRPVRSLNEELYFDQRSQEMAALRAVDGDPHEAARIANTWAQVCREMLVRAYGTVPSELEQIKGRIEQARQDVLVAQRAVENIQPQSTDTLRLELADQLDLDRQILTALNQRFAQLAVRLEDSQQIARIVSDASPPPVSINPSAGLIIGLFAFAGLLIGFTFSLLRGPAPLK